MSGSGGSGVTPRHLKLGLERSECKNSYTINVGTHTLFGRIIHPCVYVSIHLSIQLANKDEYQDECMKTSFNRR